MVESNPPVSRLGGVSPAIRWILIVLSAIALSLIPTGLLQTDLINVGGFPQLWRFVWASVHPDLSPELLGVTLDAALKTLAYAVCGTCFCVLLGMVGGVLCSEVWWEAIFRERGTRGEGRGARGEVRGARGGDGEEGGDSGTRRRGLRRAASGESAEPRSVEREEGSVQSAICNLQSVIPSSLHRFIPSRLPLTPYLIARALLAIPRAIHELIWGLLFVNLWGLDPLTAMLAIALPFGAITAKVFSEILDETPRQSLQVLLNSGVAPLTAFFYTLLPQAFLNLLSYTFYRFECSIRSATVLGLIGAGGLGYQLLLSLQSLRYEQVWTFIYALVFLNGLVDFCSAWLRRRLGCASRLDLNNGVRGARCEVRGARWGNGGDEGIQRHKDTQRIQSPICNLQSAISLRCILYLLSFILLLLFSFWYVNADFSKLWSAKTYRFLVDILQASVPPDLSNVGQLLPLAIQTVAMSVLAIALAALGGMLLSFPAAHNLLLPGGLLNPTRKGFGLAIWSWGVLLLTRAVLLLSRAVPAPVWALVVLFVMFPGILPGAIALGIHNLGILGRLKAEVVENLDTCPLEALKAQGAPGNSIFLYGILPPTLPRFLAYDLYRWEVCMRETVIVGLVGAGGLGYLMTEQLSSFDYRGLIVTLGCFLVLTWLIDWISATARRSLR